MASEASLAKYPQALQTFTQRKGKQDIVNLDKWYRGELREAIQTRDPTCINSKELVKIVRSNFHAVQWKLTRGKYRPQLLNYAKQHKDDDVKAVSTAAFAAAGVERNAGRGSIDRGIEVLAQLKGVGPATASAVLAAGMPDEVPFMSDELLMAQVGKMDYTLKTYRSLLKEVQQTLQRLNAGKDGSEAICKGDEHKEEPASKKRGKDTNTATDAKGASCSHAEKQGVLWTAETLEQATWSAVVCPEASADGAEEDAPSPKRAKR